MTPSACGITIQPPSAYRTHMLLQLSPPPHAVPARDPPPPFRQDMAPYVPLLMPELQKSLTDPLPEVGSVWEGRWVACVCCLRWGLCGRVGE